MGWGAEQDSEWNSAGDKSRHNTRASDARLRNSDFILRGMESHRKLYIASIHDQICFSEKKITQLHSRKQMMEEIIQFRAILVIQREKWGPLKGEMAIKLEQRE